MFGPGHRTLGLIQHIKKELKEIKKKPKDVKEWADIVILGFDGAWRSGHTAEEVIQAVKDKWEENMARQWPDWRTAEEGKPIEHIRD